MCRLSVVIPCRDAAWTLDAALRSVDVRDAEILVIDDASRDDSRAVAALDARVRLVALETPHGIGEVRNLALREARGRWIAFLDADDWVAPGYHERLVDAAEALDVDFLKTPLVTVTGFERRVVEPPGVATWGRAVDPRQGVDDPTRRTALDYGYVHSGLWRADFARGLDFGRALHGAEDRLFTWKAHLGARSCAWLDVPGYFYRRDVDTSLTRVGDRRQLAYLDAFDQLFAYLHETRAESQWHRKAERQLLDLALFHHDRRARLSRALRAEQRRRVRSRLIEMTPSRDVLATLGPRRVERLREMGLRRTS